MMDLSVAYHRYIFLGQEFLTWLWFAMDRKGSELREVLDESRESLEIGSRVILENRSQGTFEVISIKGHDADLEEGFIALRKGALISEIHLVYREEELEYQFSLKGESLNIHNLRISVKAEAEEPQELDSVILERIFLLEKIPGLTDRLFSHFLHLRLSAQWTEVLPKMTHWMTGKIDTPR